jgi:iron complex transport system ATP-binding protein
MMRMNGAGVRYGERWIFRHLDFTAEIGRCIAILGPNGRGKTTLVRALLGFLPLTEGHRSAPAIVGYVPQSTAAPVSYRVRSMVAMGRVAQRGLFATPTRSDQNAADEVLAQIGLSYLADQRFDLLSGGERQLVLLARALATGAAILILDEPASALDLRNQDRFLTVVESLKADGRHAIVFTTHLPQHASAVADDALMLFGAEDRVFGPAGEVLNEANLARLYDIPVRIVTIDGPADGRSVRGVVPMFGASRVA